MRLNPTTYAGRLLAAGVPLICAAILLPAAAMAAPGTPGHPQHRQLAVTTLSSFKVTLTITRSPGLKGTVTAAGYRHTTRGWKLIATKRIGRASGWFWYPTEVCSLTVTQLKPTPTGSPSVETWDSITVSLLETPALGCSNTYTKRWRP